MFLLFNGLPDPESEPDPISLFLYIHVIYSVLQKFILQYLFIVCFSY